MCDGSGWEGEQHFFLPFPAGTTGSRDGSINPSPRNGFQLMESKIPLRFHGDFCCLLQWKQPEPLQGKPSPQFPTQKWESGGIARVGPSCNPLGCRFNLQPTWMRFNLQPWIPEPGKESSPRKTLAGKCSVSMRQNTTNLVLLKLYCAIPRNFSSSVAKAGKQFLIAAFCSFPV